MTAHETLPLLSSLSPDTHTRGTSSVRHLLNVALSEKALKQVAQVWSLQTYFYLSKHHKGCQKSNFPIFPLLSRRKIITDVNVRGILSLALALLQKAHSWDTYTCVFSWALREKTFVCYTYFRYYFIWWMMNNYRAWSMLIFKIKFALPA